MNAPLYNGLVAYSNTKLAFHMPGHKFGTVAGLDKMDLAALDNTEALGMDNLYEAEGIIKQAMNLMADFYGSKETIFLTNGSTAGILTSILATCQDGDQLIVARNAHHSVWTGLELAGVNPIYISPEYLEEDILGEIKPEVVEQAICQYPNVKGVLIVSPTYEGIVSDIQAIADIVHKYNKILIVDEAHGAHFVLENGFPASSVKKGADLVINSMHKTLPALTQSALIHICSDRIQYDAVISALRMIQTSSPSYMMMGVMDYIRCYILENEATIKKQYIDELIATRQRLKKKLNVLGLLNKESNYYDQSKIVIFTMYASISGYELADLLNERYSITVEAALENYIILMTTMADQKDTLSKLEQALIEIDGEINKTSKRQDINYIFKQKICLGEKPRKILYTKKSWIKVNECEGHKSARNIMLYPPGIPIVCIGEMLDASQIELISRFKDKMQGVKIIENELFLQVSE